MKYKYILTTVFIIYLFNLSAVYSETIKISSDNLSVERDKNISIFTGNVYAKDDKIELWSDKISIFYDETKKGVYEIIAENNVKIVANEVTAYGNFSKYQVDNQELFIEGDVVVLEKGNKIKSDQLILDLANSTSIMTAKPNSRVTAHIKNLNNDE